MSRIARIILLLGDVAALYAALALTILLRYPMAEFRVRFDAHLLPFSLLFIIWVLVFWIADLYRSKTLTNRIALLNALGGAVIAAGALSITLFYLFEDHLQLTPKTNLAIFAAAFFLIDWLWRSWVFPRIHTVRPAVIVVGDTALIRQTVAYLAEHPHAGYRVIHTVPDLTPRNAEDLLQRLKEGTPAVVVVPSHIPADELPMSILSFLLAHGVFLMRFSDFYESVFEKVLLEELDERWIVECLTRGRSRYDTAKRVLDVSAALVLGVILAIPALLIALLVRITSRGPAIYAQLRQGREGIPATVYKFRTMRIAAQSDAWPLWTEANDRRITPLGKFLRFTHLDETPQLWNIFCGSLSFVGPRAERVELAQQFTVFPGYDLRHLVKPGLTGWAQINYRASASLDEAKEKLRYDLYYVKNRSLFLDVAIMVKTIAYIVRSYAA